MGRFITTPGVNPDNTHVRVDVIDPIVATSGGVLLLDFASPVTPLVGVPSSGAAFTNLVADQAAAMYPLLTATDLKPTLVLGSTFLANGIVERTGKGGLHFGRNLAAGDANTTARINLTNNMLLTNGFGATGKASHSYFVSLWALNTRAYGAGYSGAPMHSSIGTTNNMYQFYTRRTTGSTSNPTDSRRIGLRSYQDVNLSTTIGPMLQNIGVSSISGTLVEGSIFKLLNGFPGNEQSMALYKIYVEDLTQSGRSYATVDAIDWALFTQDVLTPGGRFYGDTYTNPTAIP